MKESVIFKVVAVCDGKTVYEGSLLGDAFQGFAGSLDDIKENESLFELIARMPYVYAKSCVAYRENLTPSAMDILSKDNSGVILNSLLNSYRFREYADENTIYRLLDFSASCAVSIAESFDSFSNLDSNALLRKIIDSGDVNIIGVLAKNSSVPKDIMLELSQHADNYVSECAKATLKDYEDEGEDEDEDEDEEDTTYEDDDE